MALSEIRSRIDSIDAEILELLHRRFSLALRTRRFKSRPRDPAREAEVLDRLRAAAAWSPLLRPDFLIGLYKEIFKESRRLQARTDRGRKREKPT